MCAECKAAVEARCAAARKLAEACSRAHFGIGPALRLAYRAEPAPPDMHDLALRIGAGRVTVAELQALLGARPDGIFGQQSRAALVRAFTNPVARSASVAELQDIALRLGCTLRQLAAVGAVESSGSGFDRYGRPKLRFERHWFGRLTSHRWSPAPYSDRTVDWSQFDSWERLEDACARDPDAAFASCSWGKFQVMGGHWGKLGYASPFAMAHACVAGEAAHYDMLARYVETFGLKQQLRLIGPTADACRPFARAYNGSAYADGNYHAKLARAMA